MSKTSKIILSISVFLAAFGLRLRIPVPAPVQHTDNAFTQPSNAADPPEASETWRPPIKLPARHVREDVPAPNLIDLYWWWRNMPSGLREAKLEAYFYSLTSQKQQQLVNPSIPWFCRIASDDAGACPKHSGLAHERRIGCVSALGGICDHTGGFQAYHRQDVPPEKSGETRPRDGLRDRRNA